MFYMIRVSQQSLFNTFSNTDFQLMHMEGKEKGFSHFHRNISHPIVQKSE